MSLFSFSYASNASAPLTSITWEFSESKSWPKKKIHTHTQNNPITNLYALSQTGVSEIYTEEDTNHTTPTVITTKKSKQKSPSKQLGQLLRKLKICGAEHLYPVSIVNFAFVSLHERIYKNLLQHSHHSTCLSIGQQNRRKKYFYCMQASLLLSMSPRWIIFTAIRPNKSSCPSLLQMMQRDILEKHKAAFLINYYNKKKKRRKKGWHLLPWRTKGKTLTSVEIKVWKQIT